MCVLDLDQTALHFRQALNFIAHIAYRWVHRVTDSSKQFFVLQVALGIVFSFRGGIILFVCRQPPLIHMVDRLEF